jgi:hypothetical protein
MTNLKNMNFLNLLENIHGASDADQLYDVKLVVKDANGVEQGAVQTHKLLLSLISPVFKTQFFGNIKEEKNDRSSLSEVTITAPSFPAFEKMIRYIYSGDPSIATAVQELELLFELFRLADMYMLTGLRIITREAIDRFPASSKNYAEILRLIGEFESLQTFDEICRGLSIRVAEAVCAEWKTVEDSVRFWSTDYGDDQLTKLLLMKKLQLAQEDPSKYCLDCKLPKEKCLDGKQLTEENCKVGMQVRALAPISSVQKLSVAMGQTGRVKDLLPAPGDIFCPMGNRKYRGRLSVEWSHIFSLGAGTTYIHDSMENMAICHDNQKS